MCFQVIVSQGQSSIGIRGLTVFAGERVDSCERGTNRKSLLFSLRSCQRDLCLINLRSADTSILH